MKNEKIEYIEATIERTVTWITNYDTKASIISSLIFAALAIVFTSDNRAQWFITPENKFLEVMYYILLVVIITVILSITSMFVVLIPRTNRKHVKIQKNTSDTKSIIYFNDISTIEYNSFCDTWETMKNDDYLDKVLEQLYSLSIVCSKKNLAFKMGTLFLFVASFAFCCLILISFF